MNNFCRLHFLISIISLNSALLVKYNIPYSHLKALTKISQSDLATKCISNLCFAAIYKTLHNSKIANYEYFLNVPSVCGKVPNCLSFNEEQYKYSFVYFHNLTSHQCADAQIIMENYIFLPSCPEDWFSYIRTGNIRYCFKFFKDPMTYETSASMCQSINAIFYGFQTKQERIFFENAVAEWAVLEKEALYYPYLYVGAKRKVFCHSTADCVGKKMFWEDSSLPQYMTTNGLCSTGADGSGNCLSYSAKDKCFDDENCNQKLVFVCGKKGE